MPRTSSGLIVPTDVQLTIPTVPFPHIRQRLNGLWVVREASHHSVIAQTRAGKSHLMRWGILDTCRFDRVLIIDTKGWDPTLLGLGKVVHRFPRRGMRSAKQLMHDGAAYENWFRLVTLDDFNLAKEQVEEALIEVMREGDWIVVIDELRNVVDPREPGLGLRGRWEAIRLRGGGKGVGLVDMSQEPKWLPSSFYTQSAFYWFSKIEDKASQKRIQEVAGSDVLLPILRRIRRHWWVYTDDLEDERFWAYTTPPPASRPRNSAGTGAGGRPAANTTPDANRPLWLPSWAASK